MRGKAGYAERCPYPSAAGPLEQEFFHSQRATRLDWNLELRREADGGIEVAAGGACAGVDP